LTTEALDIPIKLTLPLLVYNIAGRVSALSALGQTSALAGEWPRTPRWTLRWR
jgi:hypothetical protein